MERGVLRVLWLLWLYRERGWAPAPRWIVQCLVLAGFYNILWGTFVVLFPLAMFRWAGMPVPNYPEIWQCVGMIVGVYGLGYLIAAHNPAAHWPIVLVGFLGKVFGPIGMVLGLVQGRLPLVAGLVCVTNDLIWWVPFVAALRFAWMASLVHHRDEETQRFGEWGTQTNTD